jgi:transposase
MKAYSNDLRKKIVQAYENQEGSYRQLAKRFSVSLGFVQNLMKRYRETGEVDPLPHGGGASPKLTPDQMTLVADLIQEYPEATLTQLCDRLYEMTQVRLSQATMSRLRNRIKLKPNFPIDDRSKIDNC